MSDESELGILGALASLRRDTMDTQQPPVPPVEPEPWQCCGSGCDPCVYDRYWEALARYEQALEAWQRGKPGPAAGGPGAVDNPGGSP